MAVNMTMVDKTLIRTGKSPSYYHVFVTQRVHEKLISDFFFVTPLCKMRPAERKTRVVTLTNDNSVSGVTIANFLYRGFQTRTMRDKGSGAHRCGGA